VAAATGNLRDQVLATLRYFDVQDHPLTLLEVWKYLLVGQVSSASVDEILSTLERDLSSSIETSNGFYFLTGRSALVAQRLRNNFYAAARLRRARRYLSYVRHVPFISAVALTGSEAITNSKLGSDIDLLVITDANRMWLGRLAITTYFQLTGLRRHGSKVADRFCLNHYVAGARRLGSDHNVYTAVEYASLIPYFGADKIYDFQQRNSDWISTYLAQPFVVRYETAQRSGLARAFTALFANRVGDWLDRAAGALQAHRIKVQDYITVAPDELSFHPGSKGQQVLIKIGR
jgi:predicted nucleotidyltransferase